MSGGDVWADISGIIYYAAVGTSVLMLAAIVVVFLGLLIDRWR